MHGGRRAFLIPAARDPAPGLLVESHVEPRQYDRALRKLRDGRKQLCGCRHRAGGAGGDHRLIAAGKAPHLGLDEEVAPRGGVDLSVFVEALRPIAARDLEEIERVLPIRVELVRHQAVEPLPVHLAGNNVVDQPGEIVSKCKRGGRRVGNQRCALFGANRGGPAHDQLREQKPPVQRFDRRRKRQGVFGELCSRSVCENDLVFVQIAECNDAWQDRRVSLERCQEGVACHTAGPPGWQIKRGARKLKRIARSREAFDQAAAAQRGDQLRQEAC